MPVSSSSGRRCGSCSTTPSTRTREPCSARCRSSAARSRCIRFRASPPTWRIYQRDARFIRAAPRPCHAARARSRETSVSATGALPGAGSWKARTKRERTVAEPVLEVRGLKKHFPVRHGLLGRGRTWVKAVDGVDFAIRPGETLGLIGESGCGKTTTSKLILLQETPTAGSIAFEGRDIAGLEGTELMAYRRAVQVVFQDPFSSLSPRMRVEDIIAEPLEIHTDLSRAAIGERVAEVLELVGLQPDVAPLFPHEFSGGQRQRIAIAPALATNNPLIVLDEPVSALDVSVRAQIINQLEHLQRTLGVSYLFIGHDLATVAHISHRIAVMYLGRIVESADSDALCARPMHPYSQALFAAALPSHPDDPPRERPIAGEVPSALSVPSGCRFHPRCPSAMPICSEVEPVLRPRDDNGQVACHLYP